VVTVSPYGGKVPRYEYECRSCHHRFELKQGFDADPVETCPLCKGTSQRRFHAPAIIYKGTGFYTTDYARTSYSPPSSETNDDNSQADDKPQAVETESSATED
jgi:putative FmdB family regulatory protein